MALKEAKHVKTRTKHKKKGVFVLDQHLLVVVFGFQGF